MALLEGYDLAHGTYTAKPGSGTISRGKVEIKSSAKTVRDPVTEEAWQGHIDGVRPIGIIPIRDNNTCLWGAIDIDTYGLDHAEIVKTLKKHKLPLVVCRSKSGGAHLFLFLSEPAPAADVQEFLREASVLIGWGSSEVFPKQHSVQLERGDLGSWLNMPYFGGEETDRYAVQEDGRSMTLKQFVEYAESLQQPASFLNQSIEEFKTPEQQSTKSNPAFGDGPPCMQHLSTVGYPEGTRNKGLYALAIFAKKKFGAAWAQELERWNHELMDPPLPSSEVVDIIRGVERKDYNYPCKDQPLLAHCNSSICRTRKYGVGGDDDFPIIAGLSVLDTEPPLWFMDVEDHRVELTTEELQNYRSFHKICMEQMFKTFRMMKQDQWLQIVSEQMKNVVRIEAPREVGRTGQFEELLGAFLNDRHAGFEQEDLLVGRPFRDNTGGRIYFRLKDLDTHLMNANFRGFTRGQITSRIRKLGGDNHFFNIKNHGVNCFYVPIEAFEAYPQVDTPPLEGDPL